VSKGALDNTDAAAGRARLSELGKHSVAGLDRRLSELEA
jgi:hypothetical protein